jgi:P27 family predicted phage terminase small subunit
VVRVFGQTGVITQVDRAALAAYCQSWGRWVEAEETVARTGLVIKTTNGNLVQNPLLGIANRAKADLQRWANELGFTPASRTRIQAPEMTTEDEFSTYLKGRAVGE